jgi:hypothetical protein
METQLIRELYKEMADIVSACHKLGMLSTSQIDEINSNSRNIRSNTEAFKNSYEAAVMDIPTEMMRLFATIHKEVTDYVNHVLLTVPFIPNARWEDKDIEDRTQRLDRIEEIKKSVFDMMQERAKSEVENQNDIPHIADLLKDGNIPESISDAFYRLTWQPQSKEQIPSVAGRECYVGKLNHYNYPYHYWVHQVPILTDEYELNIEGSFYEQYGKDEVFNALKLYAEGFKYGYKTFETDFVDGKDSIGNTEDIRLKKIVNYALERKPGLYISINPENNPFATWERDGTNAGYFYRAWYLILGNYIAFEPLFKMKQQQEVQPQQPTIEQESKTIDIERLKSYFISSFTGIVGDNDILTTQLIPDINRLHTAKEKAALALIIYNSPKLKKGSKPKTFRQWCTVFFECLNEATPSYKPNSLKEIGFNGIFYYLER